MLEHRAEPDNEGPVAKLELESGYVLGEGPDAVVISASEARRLRRDDILFQTGNPVSRCLVPHCGRPIELFVSANTKIRHKEMARISTYTEIRHFRAETCTFSQKQAFRIKMPKSLAENGVNFCRKAADAGVGLPLVPQQKIFWENFILSVSSQAVHPRRIRKGLD